MSRHCAVCVGKVVKKEIKGVSPYALLRGWQCPKLGNNGGLQDIE